MKKNENYVFKFKDVLEKDCGLILSNAEAKEATDNLVNFFDLLWQFDQEDKQKIMEMKGTRNGSKFL